MQNILAPVVKESFDNWVSRDVKYKKYAKQITKPMLEMFHLALDEMEVYKPAHYNLWFVVNHMRFRHLKQTEKTLMNELVHNFLVKYTRGELENATKNTRKSKFKQE